MAGANSEIDTTRLTPRIGEMKDLIESFSHCPVCHGHLHFIHITDFSTNLTHETAKCPECGTQHRSVLHKLQ